MASNILNNNGFGGQPILTDGGPTAWAVDWELGWPSRSRGKGWPAVCKSGPLLCNFTVVQKLVEWCASPLDWYTLVVMPYFRSITNEDLKKDHLTLKLF